MISIIVSNYNKEKYITETVNSFHAQKYEQCELLIIDDCSTDNSTGLIRNLNNSSRVRVYQSEVNRGAGFCRNLGLKHAKGEYIIFLDADDLLAVDCLERRMAVASRNPDKNLFVFPMGVFRKNAGDTPGIWNPASKDPLKDLLLHKLPWSILQPLWRKDFLLRLGGFDESFERLQDVELHTRAMLHPEVRLMLVKGEPDCFYRIDEERRNFNTSQFMSRWINSAIKYYTKFFNLIPSGYKRYLAGTICETYLQLLYRFRMHELTRQEFDLLEETLFEELILAPAKKFEFKLMRANNISKFKIPLLNRVLKKLITN